MWGDRVYLPADRCYKYFESRRKFLKAVNRSYGSSQAWMDAKMAAVDDRRVEPSQKFEISAACSRFHNVQSILDAKLRKHGAI